MEARISSSSVLPVTGAVLGASAAAGVWSAAYTIDSGLTLLALGFSHAVLGGFLGMGLAIRGRVNGLGGFLYSTALLIAGAAVLGAMAPSVAGFSSLGRFSILGILAVVMAGAIIGWARSPLGNALLGLAAFAGLASFLLLPLPIIAPQAMELSPLQIESDAPLSRVAVIGIDGGDWSVIDPMIQSGELPTISGLVQRGTRGVLRSIDPMYSPVVWTSILSGMMPAQHRIRDWYSATARNRKVPLLWEIVAAAGESAIALNVPGSWPPLPFPRSIVAGFPIPRLIVSETSGSGQFFGKIVGASDHDSVVPTVVRSGKRGSVPLGRGQIMAGTSVRHPVVEEADPRHWLVEKTDSIELELVGALSDVGPLQLETQGQKITLRLGEWTPWLDVEAGGYPAFLRIRRLESGDLYITPPFQSPNKPRFNFITGDVTATDVAPDDRYVVEGVGWKAVGDPSVRSAVAEHLEQVSALRVRAAQTLAGHPWKLFGFIFTLTDRISHGYWEASNASAQESQSPNEPGEAVREAYRLVDRDLGLLLDEYGSDVTVFISSDHDFQSDRVHEGGTHPKEGIFLASGPGVYASDEMLELSVYDIAPTILAGLGLPVANDMSSDAFVDLFDSPPLPRVIESYGQKVPDPATGLTPDRIDASTEEQLRSLGYIE